MPDSGLMKEVQVIAESVGTAPILLYCDEHGKIMTAAGSLAVLGSVNYASIAGKHWSKLFGGYSRRTLPGPDGVDQFVFSKNGETSYRVKAAGCVPAGAPGLLLVIEPETELDPSRLEKLARDLCLGRMTSEFTHEMNNAFTSISGWLQIIMMDIGEDSQQRESLTIVYDEVKRLSRMCSNLLALARGQKTLGGGTTAIDNVIEGVIHVIEPRCTDADIVIERSGLTAAEVAGSADQLKQVFLNLMVNAVNAISGKGKICVVSEVQGDSVRVAISDTGCGIKPERLERIFDAFYTTRHDSGGSGLGLYVCRDIITRHKGELLVESSPGDGSTFTVILPVLRHKTE